APAWFARRPRRSRTSRGAAPGPPGTSVAPRAPPPPSRASRQRSTGRALSWRALPVLVVAPAGDRPVGREPAGVEVPGRDLDEGQRGRRRLAGVVGPPALHPSVRPQAAAVATAGREP